MKAALYDAVAHADTLLELQSVRAELESAQKLLVSKDKDVGAYRAISEAAEEECGRLEVVGGCCMTSIEVAEPFAS